MLRLYSTNFLSASRPRWTRTLADHSLFTIAIDVLVGLDFILFAFGLCVGATGLSLMFSEALPLPYTES